MKTLQSEICKITSSEARSKKKMAKMAANRATLQKLYLGLLRHTQYAS